MPRPCKRRRVQTLPRCCRFGPRGCPEGPGIVMTLDEYETIRLIDLCGLSQAETAAQMGVARATVQAIYGDARRKLAQCIVSGMELSIAGGDYELCPGASPLQTERNDKRMKIAVTYDENGQVFQHFGHCPQFKFYEVEDGRILSSEVISAGGSGHGARAGFLKSHGADTLICGGIGGGARTALSQAGITLYPGVVGDADQAVGALISGGLSFNPDFVCDHHGEGHHHGGDCGHHEGGGCGHHEGGCGEHGCHQ